MTIESNVFKRKKADRKKLEDHGFFPSPDGGSLVFRSDFMDGQFRAEVIVGEDDDIHCRVIDMDTEDEYLPIHSDHISGGFVGRVREEYREILQDIADKCFRSQDFIYEQSNRIAFAIASRWKVDPEFPWEKYEGNGTFKTKEKERWFAAILTVAFGKLEIEPDPEHPHERDEIVEVINLKARPQDVEKHILKAGICRAWHMNKKHWISVILDDRLSDDEIMELVSASREMVSRAKATVSLSNGAWIIPSNPGIYDIDAGFAKSGVIEWHQHNDIRAGDELFIYSASPNSAIMYRCTVLEADIGYNGMFKESKGYTRAMRIKLLEKYPKERFPLEFMRKHGSGPIRSARRMPDELLMAIREAGMRTNQ